ncbi:MAG: gliding motility-associated C-terminal domain-containing protein [Flavobacteriales bacterium]
MTRLLLILLLTIVSATGFTQVTEYLIADTLVAECDGRLFDSGGEGEIYGINEDFTFTVCTETIINISFQNEFCVELGLDFLTIYDGPDTASPELAMLSGTELPGNLQATSGCVTFHFTSDNSVAYCGFDLLWDSENIPPTPPTISLTEEPECGSQTLDVTVSTPIYCSEVYPEFSSLTGSSVIAIDGFQALNCDADSLATEFELTLSEPLDYDCDFELALQLGVHDNCDSIWMFTPVLEFLYQECGPDLELIVGNDPLCNDECTTIEAVIEGCFDYIITWDNGLPEGPGPHNVCPNGAVTYTATAIELVTFTTVTASYTFDHENNVILEDDFTLCQSDGAVTLTSSPAGGTWSGSGIEDESSGFFNPDLAEIGENIVYYEIAGSTCYDSLIVNLAEINAGEVTASCPFATPTLMTPEPAGGTWTGDNITPEGLFSPQDGGIYNITYSVNGCDQTLAIDVQEFTADLGLGPLCQSANTQFLTAEPEGGFWTGAGIDDGLEGTWEPEWTGAGGDITLTYNAIGCSMDYIVNVIPSQIGGRFMNSCPANDPFLIIEEPNPAGGFFEGDGFIDFTTGLFDPGSVAEDSWNELLYYAPNGCVDTVAMLVTYTSIGVDTAYFCETDAELTLDNETVQRNPWGGSWTGQGTVNVENNRYDFFPDIAGPGEHWLVYNANDCLDSMLAIVYPSELSTDMMTVCAGDPSFIIEELPTGSVWSGDGIVDSASGLFDPSLVSGQEVTISFSTPTSCGDDIIIVVEEFIQATISGAESTYCLNDVDIALELSPDWATLTGPTADGVFNPSVLGEGDYTYALNITDYDCSADTSINFTIYPPLTLELEASETVICENGGTVLNASSTTGLPEGSVTYNWSDGLLGINQHSVSPEDDQYYYLTVTDGCSDPLTDSVFIEVLDPIELSYSYGDTLCFNEPGASIEVFIEPAGDYSIFWEGDEDTETYSGTSGEVVEITVIDNVNGCESEDLVLIPSYPPISAAFTVNPSLDCIPFESNPVAFIDISQNAVSGQWDFGNETGEVYDGSSPQVEYTEAGEYTITLIAQNNGGCADTASVTICVNDPSTLFVPDIFSPNDDGANDVLFVRAEGLASLDFQLFNRWGNLVFETSSVENGWDGNVAGNKSPSGVYVYQLVARTNAGENIELSGNITLVR